MPLFNPSFSQLPQPTAQTTHDVLSVISFHFLELHIKKDTGCTVL